MVRAVVSVCRGRRVIPPWILLACATELEPTARVMPVCPSEEEFLGEQATLLCLWSQECGRVISTMAVEDCLRTPGDPDSLAVKALHECGATYDPCRAGECLATWRDNPVACERSFYATCPHGDWYVGGTECPQWWELGLEP